ncbi:MAG: hypothetical protein J1E96_01310 [Ruminococcus sp.]|nr:hypothetical protein [Ruminococcus sp.]
MRINKIIKKSLKSVEKEYRAKLNEYFYSYYFGNYEKDPRSLSIFFIFKTNIDLENIIKQKKTDEIKQRTIDCLIQNGYPSDAFESVIKSFEHDDIFIGEIDSQVSKIITSLNSSCVDISFISDEDIDNKANGDINLYLR